MLHLHVDVHRCGDIDRRLGYGRRGDSGAIRACDDLPGTESPSPIYHVDGAIDPNPYGQLAALFEDDNLEEVMYNGGTQCVKVAHRK